VIEFGAAATGWKQHPCGVDEEAPQETLLGLPQSPQRPAPKARDIRATANPPVSRQRASGRLPFGGFCGPWEM